MIIPTFRCVQPSEIVYSQKYCDENYEFRHVILTEEVFYCIPKKRVLSEQEWRQYFVMSGGWENYAIHKPEPYILLFRRPIGTVITSFDVAFRFCLIPYRFSRVFDHTHPRILTLARWTLNSRRLPSSSTSRSWPGSATLERSQTTQSIPYFHRRQCAYSCSVLIH